MQAELDEANRKLAQKEIQIQESGSIAEASLRVSNIFTDAQNAAEQYLENVYQLNSKTEEECRRMKSKAKSDAEKYYRNAMRSVDGYVIDLTDKLKAIVDVSFERNYMLRLIHEEKDETE